MKQIILGLCLLMAFAKASAAEIRVAAAADLTFALADIAKAYEKAHPGEKVSLTFGASGKLLTQIKEGAPFDLFFSADTDKAEQLVKAGKVQGTSFPYAKGHIVLYVKNQSKLKLDPNLEVLKQPSIKHIAVANPVHAPYGHLADLTLKKASLFEGVKTKLVVGENISQTAQFVDSGAAEVGIIARSLALSPNLKKNGRHQEINPELYEPLVQSGALVKGPNETAALKFKAYFMSEEGQQILKSFGLDPISL